ncbi:MAG: DMT family transporter [Anaerolineae bacterium]|nr:DMT family transporter [Anaerolineae bacterium]
MKPLNQSGRLQTIILTLLAMVAFAANSLLNRFALGQGTLDPASFTTVRLASGAIVLGLIGLFRKEKGWLKQSGGWFSAGFLFLYAIAFSFAYLSLNTGTGALILFGSVQVTMILAALYFGERPQILEWTGIILALGGLVYLVFPGLQAPSLLGSTLMTAAGISWGFYTLRGTNSKDPLADTASNFIRTVPFILAVSIINIRSIQLSTNGLIVASISGALTSGVGYTIWYAALRGLSKTRAATVQLSVPILAAWSGVVFLEENITLRLMLAGFLILGGIGLSVFGRGGSTGINN